MLLLSTPAWVAVVALSKVGASIRAVSSPPSLSAEVDSGPLDPGAKTIAMARRRARRLIRSFGDISDNKVLAIAGFFLDEGEVAVGLEDAHLDLGEIRDPVLSRAGLELVEGYAPAFQDVQTRLSISDDDYGGPF